MLSYEKNFKSDRPDGRFYSSWAAHMEMMRRDTPRLELPEDLTNESFYSWKSAVREKLRELLLMPESTPQPEPVMLYRVKREGYTVEKWELYPDDLTAVPFLVLIPDSATKDSPAPGVMCLPGSVHNKEYLVGEPLLDNPQCRFERYPERNRMALYMVKNGMVAFVLDNPETAEAGLVRGGGLYDARVRMCYGYIQSGLCYQGVSVFQKLCLLDFMKTRDYVDSDKLALCGHSLGTETAMYLAVLCDDFKAIVYNDGLRDPKNHYVSITEQDETKPLVQNIGNWHEVPGIMRWFGFSDLMASLAPMPVAFNEGGGEALFSRFFVRTSFSARRIVCRSLNIRNTPIPTAVFITVSRQSTVYRPTGTMISTTSILPITPSEKNPRSAFSKAALTYKNTGAVASNTHTAPIFVILYGLVLWVFGKGDC